MLREDITIVKLTKLGVADKMKWLQPSRSPMQRPRKGRLQRIGWNNLRKKGKSF